MATRETAAKYQLVLTPRAERGLKRIDRHAMERIAQRIDALAERPRLGKVLKSPLRGKRSLRVGDYRVIYRLDTARQKVIIESVGHRREIYG